MIKHLFKLVWNRKRSNLLIMLEIFVSFIVMFAVITLGVYYADNYNQPLGFTYENVWNISIDMQTGTDDYWSPEMVNTTRQLYLALQEFPEIEVAAGAHTAPYSLGNRTSVNVYEGKRVEMEVNEVTDDFQKVMGVQLLQGRWFEKSDDALNWKPVIINQRLARAVFGDEDPVNQNYRPWASDEEDHRVIGVVNDFRKDGEFSGLGNYLFERKRLDDPKSRPPANLLIKVRPGTPAEFEERLMSKLQAVAREWSFEISPLVRMREDAFKIRLIPLIILGLIAGFLMLMVGLGLVGVLWQNVTQRIKEIGLRRAKGAAAEDIYKQILGELVVLATFGLALGALLVVQLPLLDLISFIRPPVYFLSMVIALLVIYGLTLTAGLYPSWLATRVQPAEALHYE
ncbi:ABC transporter permease [candidate division KSB1 bacterium]|nr:ABC transporter permease [candidate division KSB1 bacterium]